MEPSVSTTIIDSPINYLNFIKEIKKFNWIDSLMKLQQFSALMRNQQGLNIKIEFEFQTSPKINHTILLSRHCISFLSKEIILNCGNLGDKLGELDLIKLTHQYEHMKSDLHETDPESQDSWLWVLRAANLQHFYLRLPKTIIARYYFIFSSLLKKDIKFTEALNTTLQLDILSIMKIGYSIFALFTMNQSFTKEQLTHTNVPYLKQLLSNENVDKFIELFSTDQLKFREEIKKFKVDDPLLKKYEFNPLKRFPILQTNSKNDNEKYIIPSQGDLIYSFSEGLYYVLLDNLSKKDKPILLDMIGRIFEEYIGLLITDSRLDCKLHAEVEYKAGKSLWKSADWIIVSDEYIFQIECKKRKPNHFVKAGIISNKKGINNFTSSVADELEKLLKKETHIKRNLINNIKYKEQEIINIIVYLDEMFAINQYARQEIISKLEKPSDNFHILGCYEFEILCQFCKDENTTLYQGLLSLESINISEIDTLNNLFSEFTASFKS